ncbi:MAG: hypothetical protein JWO60_833 [Frankiales bacterium]|nr:hypothetical protein [Frankiales bacterium]
MTATLSTPLAPAPADAPLQRLLRLDAVATAGAGLLGLALPTSVFGDVPTLLPRAVGAVLLVVAADLLLASRWSGRRLRLATTVCGELAAAWVVATVVVLAVHDLPASGVEVLGLVGLVTLGFAVAELRAVRR